MIDFIRSLFVVPSTVQSVILITLVAALGLFLGKLKVKGISLGVTFVFFVGILFSHFGLKVDSGVLHWAMNFGLILFIYALGVQVGPAFFPSFKQGGIFSNMISLGMIALSLLIALGIYFSGMPMPNVLGILSGSVTNTPLLAAAQSTLQEMNPSSHSLLNEMAIACAITYPFGAVGVIAVLLVLKKIAPTATTQTTADAPVAYVNEFEVTNAAVVGKSIAQVGQLSDRSFVISRIWRDGIVQIPDSETKLQMGDHLLIVSPQEETPILEVLLGKRVEKDWNREGLDWDAVDQELISKKIIITKSEFNGTRLGHLRLRNFYGINITRIERGGVELLSTPDLFLHLGDRLTVVGQKKSVERVATALGNEIKDLDKPNLISVFIGLFLGSIVGLIPFYLPGISNPVRIGSAGGAIIVGILMGAFGPRLHVNTYITNSAGLILRQLGLVLYLGALGLNSGEGFWAILTGPQGWQWILLGLLFTLIPSFLAGLLLLKGFHKPLGMVFGIICGSMANPMALEVVGATLKDDKHNVTYASVYPLAMFVRIITAQIFILLFAL